MEASFDHTILDIVGHLLSTIRKFISSTKSALMTLQVVQYDIHQDPND